MARPFRTPDQAAPQSDRRAAVRFSAVVEVEVTTYDGVPIAGAAENISATGFRMCSPVRVPRGERLWVRLRGGVKRRVVVMWSDGPNTGCRFVRPLGDAMLARFLGR